MGFSLRCPTLVGRSHLGRSRDDVLDIHAEYFRNFFLPALDQASLGCTMTNPSPSRRSWNASPEPPRTIEPKLCERFNEVCSCALHPTTASVSTKTGACGCTGMMIGVPAHTSPSRPCPVNTQLNSPPPAIPTPCTMRMSYCRLESNTRILRPLMVSASPGTRSTRKQLRSKCANHASP